ncbi:MAG: DNA alkylation repair protein [Oligoflexales bacterium]
MPIDANTIKNHLNSIGSPEKAEKAKRFFKKDIEKKGNIFLGISMPTLRSECSNYLNLSFEENKKLIQSKFHEHRMLALLILNLQWKKNHRYNHQEIFHYYSHILQYINNWDLVDVSAPHVPGKWLIENPKKIKKNLSIWAEDSNIWIRRISAVSTLALIRDNHLDSTYFIAEKLLQDKEDLIHKANGWILREAGKKDAHRLKIFLQKHYGVIPRTTLRYAIEKFTPQERLEWIHMKKLKTKANST